MTKVKICGIRTLDEALMASRLGAWAIGEVFASSPRRIEIDEAAAINRQLGKRLIRTGVFVNEDIETLKKIVELCYLDVVQLHGEEPPEYVEELDIPVIKTFGVSGFIDPDHVKRWRCPAYLFDTSTAGLKGGSGRTFNWEWLKNLKDCRHLILAGGLNSNNVARAIKCVRPMAVDISSGVEFPGGGKDPEKISAFMKQVKEADADVS